MIDFNEKINFMNKKIFFIKDENTFGKAKNKETITILFNSPVLMIKIVVDSSFLILLLVI